MVNASFRKIGVLQVLLAGMFFGLLGIFGKAAFARNITAGELLSLRFLTGSLLMAILQFFRFGRRGLMLGRTSFLLTIILGIGGYALFSSFYFQAIKGLSASIAVLLLYTFPLWVAIGAWIWLGESIPRSKLIIFPVTFLGLLALMWGNFEIQGFEYVLLGLLSAILYAGYILISRKYLQGSDPMTCVIYIQFFAGSALFLSSFHSLSRVAVVINDFALPILAMAIFCGIGAMGLFQSGLQKIKSWEASLLSTSEPLTAIALAAIFLNEKLSPLQIIGGILIIGAFIFMAYPDQNSRSKLII
jgi:DME family drug/metabolite transporter